MFCLCYLFIYMKNITHTHLFLWIVMTFHRLLLLLYWPNNILSPLNLNLPLRENLFALLHFQINIIYNVFFCFFGGGPDCGHVKNFRFYYPYENIWSPQCCKNKYSLSLSLSHTHTHIKKYILNKKYILQIKIINKKKSYSGTYNIHVNHKET